MRRITSSTTMPSSTSTRYSVKSPPVLLPRQTRKVRSAIGPLELFERGIGDGGEFLRRIRPRFLAHLHSVSPFLDDHVDLGPIIALARIVDPGVRATAFLTHQCGTGDRFRTDQQRAQTQGFVPAGIVL